ncbi:threonine efflux protein [Actinobacillus equuli]|nr:threonine efflux protein [Actinobacillus equuli]
MLMTIFIVQLIGLISPGPDFFISVVKRQVIIRVMRSVRVSVFLSAWQFGRL